MRGVGVAEKRRDVPHREGSFAKTVRSLHAKIGELAVANDFL